MIHHEIIPISDFRKVGLQHEYWIWFFTDSLKNEMLEITPIKKNREKYEFTPFENLIDLVQIPVYETPTKDALDFLITLDKNFVAKNIFKKNNFVPIILGFNHLRLVSSTHHPKKCFCIKGVLEIIAEMNLELLTKISID